MSCSVLGGTYAYLMQAVLACITCSILIWKKCREHSDRTWLEFGLDSSKQVAGAGWLHVSNMLCAIVFAEEFRGVDGCTWYAANIIIDTTVGLGIEWCLLNGVAWMLINCWCRCDGAAELLESGSYRSADGQFRFAAYAGQLVVWLSIVTAMKLSMVALLQAVPALVVAVNWLLSCMADTPRVKLFTVMIIVPLLMNTLQFVMTDNFIQKKSTQIKYSPTAVTPEQAEQLDPPEEGLEGREGDPAVRRPGSFAQAWLSCWGRESAAQPSSAVSSAPGRLAPGSAFGGSRDLTHE